MRRYDDPVEVRRGWVGQVGGTDSEGQEGPEQFLWRGRLWKVRSVVAHWVETGPWWLGEDARSVRGELVGAASVITGGSRSASRSPSRSAGELLDERELWRVEASRSMGNPEAEHSGVFDLSFGWEDGSWRLVGCVD